MLFTYPKTDPLWVTLFTLHWALTKYLTETTKGRKGLFWLMTGDGAQFAKVGRLSKVSLSMTVA